MNEDYKELVEYLDEKFTGIDKKFGGVDEKFASIDKRMATKQDLLGFTTKQDLLGMATKKDLLELSAKLLPREEFDLFKNETNQNFKELKESVNNLTNSVDGLVNKKAGADQEDAMVTLKLNRHEKWFHQVANKLGIKLEY